MRVVRITYARLRNLGNFENERVELEADVGCLELAEDVYRELRVRATAMLYPPERPPEEEDGAFQPTLSF